MKNYNLWLTVRINLFVLCVGALNIPGAGQSKPPVDVQAVLNWPSICRPAISDDGRHFAYIVKHSMPGMSTLVIGSTRNTWTKEFIRPIALAPVNGLFDGSGKVFAFVVNDTIFLQMLGKDSLVQIGGVSSFKTPFVDSAEWLGYLEKSSGRLTFRHLISGLERRYDSVVEFHFLDGHLAIWKEERLKGESVETMIALADLDNGRESVIWSRSSSRAKQFDAEDFAVDGAHQQLAFRWRRKADGQDVNSIWYYRSGMDSARLLLSEPYTEAPKGFMIESDRLRFSPLGSCVLLTMTSVPRESSKPDAVKVDIWSYTDSVLQSYQLNNVEPASFIAAISLNKPLTFTRVDQQDQDQIDENGDQMVTREKRSITDRWWNSYLHKSYYLTSFPSATKICFLRGPASWVLISPAGKYVIYYDLLKQNYCTYNIRNHRTINVTKGILTSFADAGYDLPGLATPVGIAGWMDQDSAILIYDNFDIWQVDPTGLKPPVNITKGFGRHKPVSLRILCEYGTLPVVNQSRRLLLSGFDRSNDYNGVYSLGWGRGDSLKLLTMGPYDYFHTPEQVGDIYNHTGAIAPATMAPIKAKRADCWIVQRMSDTEAPNYFYTTDFRSFKRLSNVRPETGYNWLTTEIVQWRLPNGALAKGVLYKPADFDSTKRYPVIFHFYEKMAFRAYQYTTPEFSDGPMNIPWFVSRGYLVFTPDIAFTLQKPGESALDVVTSAARYLSSRPYIDPKRLGLQGHSFGGFEVNYIISHSTLFAAAVDAAGLSDLLSAYGSLRGSGESSQYLAENDQERLGTSPWMNPRIYLANSPILRAEKIYTPLLIMHNKGDENVQWTQSVELFTGLRRLRKQVWMLQYDNEYHTLNIEKNQVDYTFRMTEFFDHFLKGLPAPVWMIRGIPAGLKGIETGYELDIR